MIHNFFFGGIFICRNVQVPQAGILWMNNVVRSHSTFGILYRHVFFHSKMSFFTSYLFVLIEYMMHSFECYKRNIYHQTIVMREKCLSPWFGFASARSSWMLCRRLILQRNWWQMQPYTTAGVSSIASYWWPVTASKISYCPLLSINAQECHMAQDAITCSIFNQFFWKFHN